MPKPNILFIFSDQHRADTLGCAGHPIIQTTNIDSLAANGVLFRRAYTQSPLCVPARASLITGRYPHQTGSLQNDTHGPAPQDPNFLHQLQTAGYTTAIIGKSHIGYTPQHTTEREPRLRAFGFDHVEEESGKMAIRLRSAWTNMLHDKGLLEMHQRDSIARLSKAAGSLLGITKDDSRGLALKEAWYAAPSPLPTEDYIDNFIGDRLVHFLRTYDDHNGERPFFLWAGFCNPHDPWDAPLEYSQPYLDRLDDIPIDSIQPPQDGPSEKYNATMGWFQRFAGSEHFTPERMRRMRAFYYGGISLVDKRIGDMLRVLDERGWARNTMIVYASDHGEFAGHHGLLAKVIMYETAMRVPLIIRPPAGCAPRIVDDLVELNDAGATILAAAGAEPVRGSHARSLLPYAGGHPVEARAAAFSEVYGFSTAVSGRYKYVVERENGAPCALYDLEADPQEDHNLAGDPAYAPIREDLWRRHLQPFLET